MREDTLYYLYPWRTMHNIASIYRFNTPFLNAQNEKEHLLWLLQSIKKVLHFNGIYFQEIKENRWDYYKVSFVFQEELWRIDFYYIDDINIFKGEVPAYYLPIFTCDIFLNSSFLSNNLLRKRAVDFLTTIFESFDGIDEKEFLIDINSDLYYTKWFFKLKQFPHYDFSDIYKIQKDFESRHGMEILEEFIMRFSYRSFILSKETAEEYHKIHGIMLYFIYLVYIIYQNLEKTKQAKLMLKSVKYLNSMEENTWNMELTKQRLDFVDDLNYSNFKKYREKLNLFFKLF